MKRLLPLLFSLLLLSGCGLIPKNVEFFQRKVHEVPELTSTQKEYQKRAAYLAKQRAVDVVDNALTSGASTNVIVPARDVEKLTDAVSTSLGPPVTPSTNADTAVENLTRAVAKLDRSIDAFKEKNDRDAGKKIEGTGFIQIPYFVYLGVVVLVIVVGWHLAKTALTVASVAQPAAGVGVGVMNVAGSLAGKGFSQVVAGGKKFLDWVNSEASGLEPGLKDKLTKAFTDSHQAVQDHDVQTVVKTLIK